MNFRLLSLTGKMMALIAVISLASCKKDGVSGNTDQSNAATMTDSSTTADNAYYDVLNTAFVGVTDNSTVWGVSGIHSGKTTTNSTEVLGGNNLGCAIYSLDDSVPGQYPKTLTLDFGAGCTSADGIQRSGKIIYLFNNVIVSPGATASVTFENYKVNGYGIQGQYTITNNYSDQNGTSYITQVTNGIITYPDATNYHYSHNKTYTQTAGDGTPELSDDVFSVYGTSSFSSSDGNSLVLTVSSDSPLVKALSCHYISQGIVTFLYNNALTGTIDFGNGDCDNTATVVIGNYHNVITLRGF